MTIVIFPVERSAAASLTISDSSSSPVSLSGNDTLTVDSAGALATGDEKAVTLSDPSAISITTAAGSTISGDDDGIHASSTTDGSGTISIVNDGTIHSTGGQSIDLDDVSASGVTTTITNGATGQLISDNADGIRPGNNATVINNGLISASGATGESHDGIDFQQYSGTVINKSGGVITGERHGITSSTNVDVTNEAGGTIIGRNGSGVGSDGTGTVVNYGTIIGSYDGSGPGDGDGVDIDGDFSVTNYGTISAQGAAGYDKTGQLNVSEGVALTGSGTLTNEASGVITSTQVGVTLCCNAGTQSFINYGSVYGADVGFRSTQSTVTLTNYGQISSDRFGIDNIANSGLASVLLIDNYGSISGAADALFLENGTTTVLTVHPGSEINGAISLTGSLTVDADTAYTLSGALSGTGDFTKTGNGTLVLAGDASGYSGAVTVSAGALESTASGFGSGAITDNASLVLAQKQDGTLTNTVSGTGSLLKTGSGDLTLTAENTYSGDTTVEAGTLTVSGSVAQSAVSVENGATLTGTGTTGATSVQAGGTLNTAVSGVGTQFHVNGNLGLQSGSDYVAAVGTSGNASQTVVSGALNIGQSTLIADSAAGAVLTKDSQYTLITAAGGISGAFSSFQSNLINPYYFLSPTLAYSTDSVSLLMARNSRSYASAAVTRNEYGVGSALDTMSGSSVINAIEGLDERGARHAYNALSGEIHASARTNLIQDAFYIRNAALDRLQTADCVSGVSYSTVKTSDLAGHSTAGCDNRGAALWGTAYGAWGRNGGGGNAGATHHATGGFIIGADTMAFETWRIGGLVSYGHTSFDTGAVNSSGHSDDVSVGGYAGTHWGHIHFKLGAFYSWDMLSAVRTAAIAGYRDRLSSSYPGGTAQSFGDLSYRFHVGKTAEVEPFANVAYVNVHTNHYRENGGAAALEGRAMDTGTTYSTFGVRGGASFRLGGITLTPNASLGYRHTYGLVTPTTHEAFRSGSSDFEAAGALLARDAAVLNAGMSTRLTDRVDVGLSYIGQYGRNYTDSGLRGKVTLKF
ncbi:autotransporter outer membrane beta-barrel domain-containing protein [Acetobacter oeni]|uniref:autotransporter outer membrane beta-barrel domain-containing protein n=2 Tax=Acetobacter oeni TaxID=304077 RepID=UPI0015686828|nr:autotransporter domain-containing protein [Acetobacter oeni]